MTTQHILLTLLTALGVFALIRQIVGGILGSEWFNELYRRRQHQQSLQKAYNNEKPLQIDDEYYRFKLDQLLAKDAEKRELALAYFDNVPPDPILVGKLIEILPKQRHKDLQERMLRLLCKTYVNLLKEKKETLTANSTAPSEEKATIKEWGVAISIWLTEIFLITISWLKVITPSFTQVLFVGLLLFVGMIGSVRIVIKDWRRFGKVALVAIALLLAILHFYSKSTHTGVHHVNVTSLQGYSLADVGISINYPTWLTADDVDLSKKIVSVLVRGNKSVTKDPLTLLFDYNPAVLKITDKTGKTISSRFDLPMGNPSGEPQEFYLQVLDRKALQHALPTTTITTQIETKAVKRQKVSELALEIQLENPFWKDLRDLFLFLSPLSFGGGVFWFMLDRLKKSSK
jgi:hypothetical protein